MLRLQIGKGIVGMEKGSGVQPLPLLYSVYRCSRSRTLTIRVPILRGRSLGI